MTAIESTEKWNRLVARLKIDVGSDSCLNEVLFRIGVYEAGLPARSFSEQEKSDLRQMALAAVLTRARYYELLWVDPMGWPHFRELRRLPPMTEEQREEFLKPFILDYAVRNRMV